MNYADCTYDTQTGLCVFCGIPATGSQFHTICPALNKDFYSGSCGPGTELHALLGRFGLHASGDCKCNSRAALMDANGCNWCEANIDEIVGWLRESAAERGLPFVDIAGRVLVRRAIANARRKEQARAKEAKAEGGAAPG